MPKSGWVYTAPVIDRFKQVIVGWKVCDHMDTQLVLDALNQALDARGRPSGVFHPSDKGRPYLSIKYGERLKQTCLRYIRDGSEPKMYGVSYGRLPLS